MRKLRLHVELQVHLIRQTEAGVFRKLCRVFVVHHVFVHLGGETVAAEKRGFRNGAAHRRHHDFDDVGFEFERFFVEFARPVDRRTFCVNGSAVCRSSYGKRLLIAFVRKRIGKARSEIAV